MKLTATSIIFSHLLTVIISATSAQGDRFVVDVDGKMLRAGVSYYILPLIRGNGGGLTLSSRYESTPCPLNVIQENLEVSRGLPMKVYPVNPKDGLVRLSSDLNFEFDAATVCAQSTVWRLGDVDKRTGRMYVGIGGQKGNPGIQTVRNWFRIDKEGVGYKMVFCPGVCSICRVICGDLGVYREGGKRLIGLNADKPLLVFFKRAA